MPQIVQRDDWVDAVPLGKRIKAADGFTVREGKVYGRIKTERWGSALRIKFDDYTFDTCYGLNTGPGIGWHLEGTDSYRKAV